VLTSIIEKRLSLHRNLANKHEENEALKSQIGKLQALANIGIVTCMIGHEINNLLTPMSSYAAFALDNPDDKALTEKALGKAIKNCKRASEIMESMLAVADGRTQEKKNAQLNILVEEIFNCLCRDFGKDGITVKIEIPEDLTVQAVPVQIQQVLMNLIINARDAMLPGGGVLTIRAQDYGDKVGISVVDTGCGIKPKDLNKIFEPFFSKKTLKESQSKRCGAGLGLVFCKKIVEAHGGKISVESKPTSGTAFNIILPKIP
jgi:signal transduction histidine kinase